MLLFGPVPCGTLFVAEAVRQPSGGHCPQIYLLLPPIWDTKAFWSRGAATPLPQAQSHEGGELCLSLCLKYDSPAQPKSVD